MFVYAYLCVYLCVCVLLFPKLLLLVPFSTPGSPGYACLSKPLPCWGHSQVADVALPPVGSSCVLLIFPTALHPKWNIQPTSRFAGRVREKTHAADFQSAAVVFDQSSIWIPAVASVLPSSSWQLELEFSLQNSGATGQLVPVGTCRSCRSCFSLEPDPRHQRAVAELAGRGPDTQRREGLPHWRSGSRTQNVSKLAWPMMIQYIYINDWLWDIVRRMWKSKSNKCMCEKGCENQEMWLHKTRKFSGPLLWVNRGWELGEGRGRRTFDIDNNDNSI